VHVNGQEQKNRTFERKYAMSLHENIYILPLFESIRPGSTTNYSLTRMDKAIYQTEFPLGNAAGQTVYSRSGGVITV
jgi:hypothetical protein